MVHTAPRRRVKTYSLNNSFDVSSLRFAEYSYYLYLAYAFIGPAVGLSFDLVGVATLGVLAAYCCLQVRSRPKIVYTAISFPLACAFFLLLTQWLVHGESLMNPDNRAFFAWVLTLIIVQSLTLRAGFSHRFAIAAFLIGLGMLPFLRIYDGAYGPARAGLDTGIPLSNPNDLAAWFGFCAVYLLVRGIETTRLSIRAATWSCAVGCLSLIGLTVGRGALLAVAVATVVALRRALKKRFPLVLSLVVCCWFVSQTEFFQQFEASYTERGTEDTGRFSLWPLVMERIAGSPLVGVPVSDVETYVPGTSHPITPHNSFLYVALISGIIPFAFFVAYWWRSGISAFRVNAARNADAPFYLPLFVYALLIANQLTTPFMMPWMIVTLSAPLAAATRRRAHDSILQHNRRVRPTRARDAHEQSVLAPHNFTGVR